MRNTRKSIGFILSLVLLIGALTAIIGTANRRDVRARDHGLVDDASGAEPGSCKPPSTEARSSTPTAADETTKTFCPF